jgi:hypothetical protein
MVEELARPNGYGAQEKAAHSGRDGNPGRMVQEFRERKANGRGRRVRSPGAQRKLNKTQPQRTARAQREEVIRG